MLVNRTLRVRVGSMISLSFDQVESVLCFALAINNIVTAVPDGVSCSLYVDDFLLYLSGSILPSAVRQIQLAINRVADWTESHSFPFSVEKSYAVLFHPTLRVFPEPSPTPYGHLLSVVCEVRFLGRIFD